MQGEVALDARLVGDLAAVEAQASTAAQLARQATGGDLDAFEELIRCLQRRVYGFAYQHLRDSSEAHDLAQEIFVKLYRNLGRYDSTRPFEPWFWKLAANTTINYRRKRIPMPVELSDESAGETPKAQHDPPLPEALPPLDPASRLPTLLPSYATPSLAQVGPSPR